MGTPRAGRLSKIDIENAVSSGVYMDIGGVQDAKLKITVNAIETTDKDSAGWDEFIVGNGNATIDLTCVYEEDDTGQAELIEIILSKERRNFRFRPWGDVTSSDEWIWNGLPTSVEIDSPNKDALSFPVSIQLSGTPINQNQP
jgi:predicted secreted protein